METPAKTLGESYEGCLSRDWEKLIGIIDAEGVRIAIFFEDHACKGESVRSHYPQIVSTIGSAGYYMRGYCRDRDQAMKVLDRECLGWFPTKEDAPYPVVALPPLRWCYEDGFSKNLKARDEWPTSNGCTASGHIRYTIDTEGYWRIFPERSLGGGFAHGYEADQDAAIKKIEKWREANMYMPLMRPTKEDEL